jgi:hypothetical protein
MGLFNRSSKKLNPDQPIRVEIKGSPKQTLLSYNEAIAGLKSGDPAQMFSAIGLNIAQAPNQYNEISLAQNPPTGEGLIDLLLSLLKHPEYQVRNSIPGILGAIGEERFIPYLDEVVAHDDRARTVANAREAIEVIKGRQANLDSVRYRRTYQKVVPAAPFGGGARVGTYEEYSAPSKVVARAFLSKLPVTEELHYIEVITPEGNLGKDRLNIY